jgi:hypothetical protein
MNSGSKPLPPEKVRLASAFADPVYERLELDEGGTRVRHLLAFVRPVPKSVQELLMHLGAIPHTRFQANCYAAIWELPQEWSAKPMLRFLELDQSISAGLRTVEGRFPAGAGYWFYGGQSKDSPDHVSSRLLQLSQEQGRSRAR